MTDFASSLGVDLPHSISRRHLMASMSVVPASQSLRVKVEEHAGYLGGEFEDATKSLTQGHGVTSYYSLIRLRED